VAYTPDGKGIVVTSQHPVFGGKLPVADCTIQLLNAETGKLIFAFDGHRTSDMSGVYFLSIAADGKTMVSAAREDASRVWNLETGKEIKSLKIARLTEVDGASHDGSRVAARTLEAVSILDTETGQEVASLNQRGFGQVDFSPDGQRVAMSSGMDGIIGIWDLKDRRLEERITLPANWSPTSRRFSADGKKLYFVAAAKGGGRSALGMKELGSDGAATLLQIWDEDGGSLVASADGKALAELSVKYGASPAGKNFVRIWRLPASGASASVTTSVPPMPAGGEDQLDLLTAKAGDKSLAPVLRFVGNDLEKALRAGNRMVDTAKVDAVVRVDDKDPKAGTLSWRGYEWRHGGATDVTNLGQPGIVLKLRRKSPTTTDWELTEEAIQTIRARLVKQ
jgi:hypothetical protein